MSIDLDFQFRAVLLKIQDLLSQDDRMKLHFLFGNDIPRVLRENGSLEESIRVLQTLFDRMKISSDNFGYLVEGLKAIERPDCAKKLEEYERLIRPMKLFAELEISQRTTPMDILQSCEETDEITVENLSIKFECPEPLPIDFDSIDLSPFENESSIWTEEYSRSLNLPFHPRNYQIEILRNAIRHGNSIVCLRTGSGKTFIASVLIKYFWMKSRSSAFRTLFFVPRKAIRLQQAKAIVQIGNLRVKICNDDQTIDQIIEQAQVIVTTPQKFVNVLKKGTVRLSQIDLMIFDECHNTSGGNPFCEIMKYYLCPSLKQTNDEEKQTKIFGLTASISSKDSIEKREPIEKNLLSICSRLACENISTVCQKENLDELNRDVSRPMNDPFEFLSVKQNHLKEFLQRFDAMIRKILDQLDENATLKSKLLGSSPFIAALVLLKKNFEIKGQTNNVIICDYLMMLTKKYLSLFDLPVSMVFQHMISQIENYHKHFQESPPIDSILYEFSHGSLTSILSDLENRSLKNLKLEHLITLIRRHATPKSKGLILVQKTFYAKTLCDFLNENVQLKDIAKATWIVGQSSSDYSQTINEQEDKLKLFQDGQVNVLVATDIVQEGLDIPTCSYVIRYEFVSDEIGTIQSRGRARAENSSYYLITERDSDNHNREKSNRIREEMMEKMIDEWPKIDRERFQRDVQTKKNSLIVEWEREIVRQRAEQEKLRSLGKGTGDIGCRRCNRVIGRIEWLRRRNTTYFIAEPEFFAKNETEVSDILKNFLENQVLGEVKCQCGNSLGGYLRFTDRTDLGPLCALKCDQIKFLLDHQPVYVEFKQWKLNNRFDVEELEEN